MRSRKILLAASVLALAVYSSHAMAADPFVDSSHDWNGLYIGAHAGYGWGESDIDLLGLAPGYSYDVDGVLGGIQAGYNWQQGALVLGLEGDIGAKLYKGDDAGFLGALDSIDGNWGGSVRARAGLAHDAFLFYATGGVAWLNYDYNSKIVPAGPTAKFSDTDLGWTVGGGVEYAFQENWTAKLEYLYTDYGKQGRSDPIFATPWKTDLQTHDVRIGINYAFGGP